MILMMRMMKVERDRRHWKISPNSRVTQCSQCIHIYFCLFFIYFIVSRACELNGWSGQDLSLSPFWPQLAGEQTGGERRLVWRWRRLYCC